MSGKAILASMYMKPGEASQGSVETTSVRVVRERKDKKCCGGAAVN